MSGVTLSLAQLSFLMSLTSRKAENYVSTFLDCLDSDNPDIVMSALKNLGEFTALCHGEFLTSDQFCVCKSSFFILSLWVLYCHPRQGL